MSNRNFILSFAILCLFWTLPLFGQATCSGEIGFTNVRSAVNPSDVIFLNLFSTVSLPSGTCLPAEIRLSASFYDADQNLVCSGIIENFSQQNASVQNTNLELRPGNIVEFVRLRLPQRPAPKRLVCMNPEGNIEVPPIEIIKAVSLRLRATILPKGGGVATSEARMILSGR